MNRDPTKSTWSDPVVLQKFNPFQAPDRVGGNLTKDNTIPFCPNYPPEGRKERE